VVETLPFELTLNPEQLPPANPSQPRPLTWQDQFLKNKVFVIGVGVGAGLLLALLLVILRVTRTKGPSGSVALPGELAAGSEEESLQSKIESRLADQVAQRQKQETEALNSLKLPPVTKKTAVLTKHISEQAKKDSAGMAHVLRAWMAESGDEMKR
jgi:flagellar biosynthesis/type III secretory pathway M-ring protein FliF/YscJ